MPSISQCQKVLYFLIIGNATFHVAKAQLGPIAVNSQLIAILFAMIMAAKILTKTDVSLLRIDKSTARILLFFTIYVFIAVLSLWLPSARFTIQIVGLLITLTYTFCLAYIFAWLSLSRRFPSVLLNCSNLIVWISILQAALGLLQVLLGHPIVPKDHSEEWQNIETHRASGTYRDPVDFAFFLSIGLYFSVFNFYSSRNIKKYRPMITILLVAAILASQSFTVMTGILIGFFICFIFSDTQLKVRLISVTICTLTVATYLAFFGATVETKIGNMIEYRLTAYKDPGNEPRQLHIQVGFEMLKESNYWGYGYGMYDTKSPDFVTGDTFVSLKYMAKFKKATVPIMISHSLPATIAGELGVAGLISFAMFYLSVMTVAVLRIGRRDSTFFVSVCILVTISMRFISYGFRLSDAFLFFIIFFLTAAGRIKRNNERADL